MKAVILTALAATASAGTLSLEVARNENDGARLLRRGSKLPDVQLNDRGSSYSVELEVGTPPQKVPVTIDTGSSDTWVMTSDVKMCQEKDANCLPTFDMSKSKSLKKLNVGGPHDDKKLPFKVKYGVGDTVNGTYVSDTVTVSGVKLKDQRIGAGTVADPGFRSGILGLGYNTVSGEAREKDPLVNHTIVDALVENGSINRRIFSLALGHTDSANGSLLFGGVDTERYFDSLVSVPFVPTHGAPYAIEYAVEFQGIDVKGLDGASAGSSKDKVVAVLDNGAPQVILPEEIIKPIMDKFGNVYIQSHGREVGGLVDCAMGRKYANARLGFKLAGQTIWMTGAQAVRNVWSEPEQRGVKQQIGSKADSWDGVCSLAFTRTADGLPPLIGDPFLRLAYAVYDMDNKVVGIAQANINSTKQKIVEVGKKDGIPTKKGKSAPKSISDPDAAAGMLRVPVMAIFAAAVGAMVLM